MLSKGRFPTQRKFIRCLHCWQHLTIFGGTDMTAARVTSPPEIQTIPSRVDGLPLSVEILAPDTGVQGVVQISHGMADHKERYEDFMAFLAQHGYAAVIHDHRGHGKSVRDPADLGYFYTEDSGAVTEDLYTVSAMIKARYPGLPLYLFSHSMGTLVARNYLKTHDDAVQKLVLCGPPTRNPAVDLAILLARLSTKRKGPQHRNLLLNRLAFGAAGKRFEDPNGWLSSNADAVDRYRQDPLCGYVFPNNGFLNLFQLLKGAYQTDGWRVSNPNLPIFLIAGADDPIIQSKKKFEDLCQFFRQRGYQHISSKLYEGMRHELLNETEREQVYQDILRFFDAHADAL